MLAEVTAGLGSLKAALDLAKGLNAAATQATVNEVKLSLQSHILDAQQSLFAAQEAQTASADRIRALEEQVVRSEDWQREKQRYELKAIDTGALAYMLKPGMEQGEPPQWLCTTCFDKGQKAYLTFKGQMMASGGGRSEHAKWGCNSCKAEVLVYYRRKPSEPWPKPADSA